MADVIKRLKEHYAIADYYGYETVGVFLQGSQNYGLDTPTSDIDSKVITIPKFDEFLFNKKPVSFTHIMNNDEHVDFKDIRLMFNCFRKQNINFVEILFTDKFILNHKYADLWWKLRNHAEEIARYDEVAALNCMAGMSYQKYKALTHPYPSIVEKIEKYGYDAKQLHHIIRLREFMERYINGVPYADCLKSEMRGNLVAIKQFKYDLKTAQAIADNTIEEIVKIKNDFLKDKSKLQKNQDVEDLLNEVMFEIIKRSFIEELKLGD